LANIKSQKKRIKTNELARLRNKAVRSELKTSVKKVDSVVGSGDQEAAAVAAQDASRLLDRAVTKGVVPKNRAANHKSRMAGQVKRMEG